MRIDNDQKLHSKGNGQSGLTFLEVIFAIMILLVLTMSAAQMIRNGVDVQLSLAEQARVSHRIDVAMQRVTSDLEHAFLINRKRPESFYTTRKFKSIFAIDDKRGSSELRFTTMNHRPLIAQSRESDQNYVFYRLEKKDAGGPSHLYRGVSPVIPEEFNDDIRFELLSKNIKTFRIEAWNGDRWTKEWDSDKSDFRDLLPHMVRVVVEAYAFDILEGDIIDESEQVATRRMETIIFLPRAYGGGKEPKERNSSPKIF